MAWDRIEGNWKQFRGQVREKWGKLTDDDLDVIAGHRDKLAGRIQEAYGLGKADADREIDEWERSVSTSRGATDRPSRPS